MVSVPRNSRPRAFLVLANGAREVVGGQAVDDLRPCLAVVARLVDVWGAVGALIAVAGEVGRTGVVRRGFDQADARELGQVLAA